MDKVFDYEGSHVRVIDRDGTAWFCAKDVCDALHLTNARKAMYQLLPEDVITVTLSYAASGHRVNFISESGLYKLIMRSNKPEARKFQNWVTHDVLPSIRKTGQYSMPGLPTMLPEQTAALTAAAEAIVQRARRMLANRRWQLRLLMTQWGYTADEFKQIAAEAAEVPGTVGGFDWHRWDVGTPTAEDLRRACAAQEVLPDESVGRPGIHP